MNKAIALLNKIKEASDAYYNTGYPIIDDAEYDMLIDQLDKIEKETGIIYRNFVGAEVVDSIDTVELGVPMLSLDKCHSKEELIKFAGDDDCVISLKMDGLSTRLTYINGELISATTRGDGYVGNNILFHVKEYENVPLKIPYKNKLIVDGESFISYNHFEEVNNNLPDGVDKFKNSRNLASGTLSGHDANVTKKRHMQFSAWRVIEGYDDIDSNFFRLKELEKNGFMITPMWTYTKSDSIYLADILNKVKETASSMSLPIDGAVMAKDSISLANSMGRTDKFFYHSLAFKYSDDKYETHLTGIEWSVGRTSITPVALFDAVVIDGTDVNRASLHNISCIKELGLTNGCTCKIFKANLIIPQIDSCDNDGNGPIEIPTICPACGGKTEIKQTDIAEVLVCTNPYCSGKIQAQFENFVSKRCLDIKGMSSATIDMLISNGLIKQFIDIYHLDNYYDELITIEGYGRKSIDKLLAAIDKSRHTTLDRFICALGIDGVGPSTAKIIANYFDGDYNKWIDAASNHFNWTKLDDIGDIVSDNINEYMYEHINMIVELADEFTFKVQEQSTDSSLNGLRFCITGTFSQSRDLFKKQLEDKGAKFVSSVSKNLDILFAGDKAGGKLTKAQELGIRIANESELLDMLK